MTAETQMSDLTAGLCPRCAGTGKDATATGIACRKCGGTGSRGAPRPFSEATMEGAEPMAVTIEQLQAAHIERQEEWCPDQKPDLSFRGNEMAGEVGEACNVIKKLERERHGWRGSRATLDDLASELADVVHTAVLCAITAGIDLGPAIVAKFNATSVKNGLASRILSALVPAPAPTLEATAPAVSEAEVTSGQVQDAADVLWRMLDLNNHTVDGVRRAARAALEAAQRARK